jgi:hypothetical protein
MFIHSALNLLVFCQTPDRDDLMKKVVALSEQLEKRQSQVNELKNQIGEKNAEICRLQKSLGLICVYDPVLAAATKAGLILPEKLPKLASLPAPEKKRLSDLFWSDTPAFHREVALLISKLPVEAAVAAPVPAPALHKVVEPIPNDPLAAEARDLAERLSDNTTLLMQCEHQAGERDLEIKRLKNELDKLLHPLTSGTKEKPTLHRRLILPETLAPLHSQLQNSPQKLAELEALLWQDPEALTEELNRLAQLQINPAKKSSPAP